ncbi:PPOX class F420-dependent oxidoreductase [Labedaea rhizosphaerae]|uniref:Uncharacterized protein n=1 Tax=Labedaea rhizosphaerae TaxID=598644 RepID=A0A4R6SDI6_LABRH|nr:PPOX class F420-dependent oxidoreductase [Labedaea rhizosphaerae]TDP97155.1 hypothetical protein EV186_103116 [Labedaea rhizosphaerae]
MTAEELGAGKYLLLTTFRREGTAVPTPVWVVADGEALYAWSAADAGKVKRIRRDGAVLLAECDFKGNPSGPSHPGTARLMDAEGTERVRELIRRKYGITGRLTLFGSRLRRGKSGTIGIELRLR